MPLGSDYIGEFSLFKNKKWLARRKKIFEQTKYGIPRVSTAHRYKPSSQKLKKTKQLLLNLTCRKCIYFHETPDVHGVMHPIRDCNKKPIDCLKERLVSL